MYAKSTKTKSINPQSPSYTNPAVWQRFIDLGFTAYQPIASYLKPEYIFRLKNFWGGNNDLLIQVQLIELGSPISNSAITLPTHPSL